MGVGSSREIEEQLEAALALLDAARAKQDQLRSENNALQARITAQAASLLLHEDQAKGHSVAGNVHLVQQREPLSKRVLASMAVVAALAAHRLAKGLGLQAALQHVELVEPQIFAQGMCLVGVFVLLLRYRRYKWRRIRPERILFRRGGRNHMRSREDTASHAGSGAGSPGTRSPRPMVEGPPAQHISSLLASEAELVVLAEAKAELYKIVPRPALLPADEPLLDVQLIRFLREHGPNASKIVSGYRRALEWRQKMLPHIPETANPLDWLSSSEMVNGAWATQFAHIGIYCGKSKIGCPVKIERLGR